MAQIKKKFIGHDQVGSGQIQLENGQAIRSKNSAGNGELEILKVNASDKVELPHAPQVGSDVLALMGEVTAADDAVLLEAQKIFERGEGNQSIDMSPIVEGFYQVGSSLTDRNYRFSGNVPAFQVRLPVAIGLEVGHMVRVYNANTAKPILGGDTSNGVISVKLQDGVTNATTSYMMYPGEIVEWRLLDNSTANGQWSRTTLKVLNVSTNVPFSVVQRDSAGGFTASQIKITDSSNQPLAPSAAEHAANKKYVDDSMSAEVTRSNGYADAAAAAALSQASVDAEALIIEDRGWNSVAMTEAGTYSISGTSNGDRLFRFTGSVAAFTCQLPADASLPVGYSVLLMNQNSWKGTIALPDNGKLTVNNASAVSVGSLRAGENAYFVLAAPGSWQKVQSKLSVDSGNVPYITVMRDATGGFSAGQISMVDGSGLALSPTADAHAATKKYVDADQGYQQVIANGTPVSIPAGARFIALAATANTVITLPSTAGLQIGSQLLIRNSSQYTMSFQTASGQAMAANTNLVMASMLLVCTNNASDATTSWYFGGKTQIAYSSGTVNSAVLRDANGDFVAHDITANKIAGLAAPVAGTDAANRTYVDAADVALANADLAGMGYNRMQLTSGATGGSTVIPVGTDKRYWVIAGGFNDHTVVLPDLALVPAGYQVWINQASAKAQAFGALSDGWVQVNDSTGAEMEKLTGGTIAAYIVRDNAGTKMWSGYYPQLKQTAASEPSTIVKRDTVDGGFVAGAIKSRNADGSPFVASLPDELMTYQATIDRIASEATDRIQGIADEADARSAEDLTFVKLDGSRAMSGALDMASHQIVGLSDGSAAAHAVNKGQMDAVQAALETSIAGLQTGTEWRPGARAATSDARLVSVSDGTALAPLLPLSDDDTPYMTIAEFFDGDFILVKAGASSRVLKVYNDAGTLKLTSAGVDPIAAGHTFIVKNDLPDQPGSREGDAMYSFNGTDLIKIGDFDWSVASGINLSGDYAQVASSPVLPGDSLEAAVAKVEGQIDAEAARAATEEAKFVMLDGTRAMSGNLDLDGHQLVGVNKVKGDSATFVIEPSDSSGSLSIEYAAGSLAMTRGPSDFIHWTAGNALELSAVGQVVLKGTSISANGKNIVDLAAPVLDTDAATKKYVDDAKPLVDDVTIMLASGTTLVGLKPKKESFVLAGADITAQYIDLSFKAAADSINLSIDGVMQYEGEDYTLSVVAEKTRITFAGDLATGGASALAAGDKLRVQYMYL